MTKDIKYLIVAFLTDDRKVQYGSSMETEDKNIHMS